MSPLPRWDIVEGERLLRAGGGRRTRLIAEESRRALGWFYLSFASERGFLGAIIVWAHGILTAVERASRLGINPGGDVLCYPIPRKQLRRVPADLRDRLLSEAEVRRRLEGKRLDE